MDGIFECIPSVGVLGAGGIETGCLISPEGDELRSHNMHIIYTVCAFG